MQIGPICIQGRMHECRTFLICHFLEMRCLTSSLNFVEQFTVNKGPEHCSFGRLKSWGNLSIHMHSSNMDSSRKQLWQDSLCSIWSYNICTSETGWHLHVLCEPCVCVCVCFFSLAQNVRAKVAWIPKCNVSNFFHCQPNENKPLTLTNKGFVPPVLSV